MTLFLESISSIKDIIEQYEKLKENTHITDDIEKQQNILYEIIKKYDYISDHFYPEELIQHKNSIAKLEILKEDMRKIKEDAEDVYDKQVFMNTLNIIILVLTLTCTKKALQINLEKENVVANVKNLSNNIDDLLESLYGKARLFEDNNLAFKLWLLCNGQDKEFIGKNTFVDRLIYIVKKETKDKFKIEYVQRAKLFAHKIDGCIGGIPDKLISIDELKYATDNLPQDLTIREILGLDCKIIRPEKKMKETAVVQEYEHKLTDIITKEFHLYGTDNAKIDEFLICKEYGIGFGWRVKEICTKITPPQEIKRISIQFRANSKISDLGELSSVRYTLNNDIPKLMYFIDNEEFPDGQYVYQIIENIQPKSKLSIYMCCGMSESAYLGISGLTIIYLTS